MLTLSVFSESSCLRLRDLRPLQPLKLADVSFRSLARFTVVRLRSPEAFRVLRLAQLLRLRVFKESRPLALRDVRPVFSAVRVSSLVLPETSRDFRPVLSETTRILRSTAPDRLMDVIWFLSHLTV